MSVATLLQGKVSIIDIEYDEAIMKLHMKWVISTNRFYVGASFQLQISLTSVGVKMIGRHGPFLLCLAQVRFIMLSIVLRISPPAGEIKASQVRPYQDVTMCMTWLLKAGR